MTQPVISARHIGREGEPIAVIDDFCADPESLRAAARAARFTPVERYYPGIRAPLPPAYLTDQRETLSAALCNVFGLRPDADIIEAAFSMVTTPAHDLSVAQRVPHVDTVEPCRIALVHFLVPGGADGTAFFRHRASGFETLDADRARVFYPSLDRELCERGVPPATYIADSTALFERIALVEGRYNRAILYRSALLHSGAITDLSALSDDPARGRLTVTAFLAGRRQQDGVVEA
jgi:hypothetical protein